MKQAKKSLKNQLTQLVRQHGTPLFIISKSKLVEQVKKFRGLMPRVTPYYAIKANSLPTVLQVFAKAGTWFDVASVHEIDKVLKLGVHPNRLIFANTVKQPGALKFATAHKVKLMTFDSEYELEKMAEYAPGAWVLIRIKVPNVGSIVELSLKFGAEPADAMALLIKAYHLGLKPVGVSFHVGSQCTNVGNYMESLEMASIIFNDARLKNMPLEILDIGGGFPIKYSDDEKELFQEMAPLINREIDRLFDANIKIIAEPGRALVGPACILAMQVIGKSIRGNKHWYYLNDGVYGSLSGIIYDHCKYQYKVLKKGFPQITTLAGPTCDSFDIISVSEYLPELDFGDIVYVENIGAYSWVTATNFNGIPPAKVVSIP